MSFISYAQNFEDVMLWRALKHINDGFYVDVGAAWPDEHSVTKAFYEKGWRGINIEPNPQFHEKLQESRVRDINLKVAISDSPGSLEMSFINDTGLSTLDLKISSTHQEAGWNVNTQFVDIKNLRNIWDEHIPQGQEVHFLKIDIEGLEDTAIRGNDWAHNRPWIVVVEATLPMSQVESHHTWEPMLLQAGYSFAYADGLNRFYVANEHNELLPAFQYPPNVFDDYILFSHSDALHRASHAKNQVTHANERTIRAEAQAAQANERTIRAEAQAAQANERANHAEALVTQANERANVASQQYQTIINSHSWKLTKPLRLASKFAQWFVRGIKAWFTLAPGSRPRRVIRSGLVLAMNEVHSRPGLRTWALKVLSKFPRLQQRLRNIAFADADHVQQVQEYGDAAHLSPRARQIYNKLKAAVN